MPTASSVSQPPRWSKALCYLIWAPLVLCALSAGTLLGLDMSFGVVNESSSDSALLYLVVVLAGISGLFVPLLTGLGMLSLLVWLWRFGRAFGELPVLSQTMHSGQAAALCMVPILGWVVPYQLTKVYWDKTGGGELSGVHRFWWPVFFVGEILRRIAVVTGREELTMLTPVSYLLIGIGAAMFVQTLRALSRRRTNTTPLATPQPVV